MGSVLQPLAKSPAPSYKAEQSQVSGAINFLYSWLTLQQSQVRPRNLLVIHSQRSRLYLSRWSPRWENRKCAIPPHFPQAPVFWDKLQADRLVAFQATTYVRFR